MNIPHSRPTREEASTRTETSSSPPSPPPSPSSSPSPLEKENGPYRSESVFFIWQLVQTVEKGYKLSMSLSAASMESGGGPAVASRRTAEDPSLLLSLDFFKEKSFYFSHMGKLSCAPLARGIPRSLEDVLQHGYPADGALADGRLVQLHNDNSLLAVLNKNFAFFNLP